MTTAGFRVIAPMLLLGTLSMLGCAKKGATVCPTEGDLRERIECAADRDDWSTVPAEYREWAEAMFQLRIELALKNLGEDPSPEQVEQATANAAPVANLIAQYAEQECTPETCLTDHVEVPEIEQQLHMDMCPGFFPFC
jgi:hypothetical protein